MKTGILKTKNASVCYIHNTFAPDGGNEIRLNTNSI